MSTIIECVPNCSEGQRTEVVEAIAADAQSVPGVMLINYSADASHNRSVFTLAGSPAGIEEAAFRVAKRAAETIDLTKHRGEHPRMGAVDVIPFIPLREASMEECVALSKRLGERLYQELGIPVFLYEEAATREERRNLAEVRRGGFEKMPEKLLLPQWQPDFGERKMHPTAGVTAVGARQPLIAFNVNLDTADLAVAKKIAKAIRGSSGGLKYCKAIGVLLSDRNTAQVSMNMVDHEGTPLYRVFEMIRAEANRYGVGIRGSEIIGAAPAKALVDCAEYYLRIEGFDYRRQVLENAIWEI